jgi:hypothetical protein
MESNHTVLYIGYRYCRIERPVQFKTFSSKMIDAFSKKKLSSYFLAYRGKYVPTDGWTKGPLLPFLAKDLFAKNLQQ